jgi:PilZ domain
MAITEQTAERRADLRAPVSLLGAIDTPEGECPVIVIDLSPQGARIQIDDPPDPEHEYALHFSVHQQAYDTRLRVAHWLSNDGSYHWGCAFLDLSPNEIEGLRRTVYAAAGMAEAFVREWSEVGDDAASNPETPVLVGRTPSGQDICLAAADCLELGQDGVGRLSGLWPASKTPSSEAPSY